MTEPSPRNGMTTILEIALVPTGDVVVSRFSSQAATPRLTQHERCRESRPFPEVKSLDRALFERDFRRFQLLFRPEDLRY